MNLRITTIALLFTTGILGEPYAVADQHEADRSLRKIPLHDVDVHLISADGHDAATNSTVSSDVSVVEGTSSVLPIASVETKGPVQINKNQQAVFRLTVNNLGDYSIDAVLIVQLPDHLQFVQSTPRPAINRGRQLQYQMGVLGAKRTNQVVLTTKATGKGTVPLTTSLQLASSSRLTVTVREPALNLTVSGPREVVFGNALKHKVVVTNTGDGPAANITIRQILRGDATTPPLQGTVRRIGRLAPGQAQEVYFRATAQTNGTLDVHYNATADGGVEQTAKAHAKVLRPMLNVAIEGPDITYLKRLAGYSIHVTNPGDAPATDVRVVLEIPAGMNVTTISQPAQFDPKKQKLTWVLPSVPAGQGEAIMVFKGIAAREGELIHNVSATADYGLSAQANKITKALSRADLSIQIADAGTPLEVGNETEFHITIENRGTQAAGNVVVRVNLPDSIDAIKSRDYSVTGRALKFSATALKPGRKRVLTVKTIGKRQGEHIVRAILQSDASRYEIIAEKSIFVYAVGSPRVARTTGRDATSHDDNKKEIGRNGLDRHFH